LGIFSDAEQICKKKKEQHLHILKEQSSQKKLYWSIFRTCCSILMITFTI